MNTINYNKFLQEAMKTAREHDTPISGCFELTPLCNLDCKMCYVHLSDPSVKAHMLSGDEWIALMEQAIVHGMMKALLTGGEAMTHPDFRRIYMYLMGQGIIVQVKTNGILLSKDMIKMFTNYPPYSIDVSLYGCDEESYQAVSGHNAFETVTTNIRAAIKAGLHIRLMVTPSAYMLPWVDRIMEYAKIFGADDVIVNAMLMEANPGTERSVEDFGLSLEENGRIHREYRDKFPRLQKSLVEEEEELMGGIPDDEPHILRHGLYCNGGRTGFAMNWDGKMGPCLGFPRDVICVDAKHLGFEAAWREVNKDVKNYAVPEECHVCSYNTKCHYCPVQHKSVAAQHLCITEMCAWRKLQADIAVEYKKRLSLDQREVDRKAEGSSESAADYLNRPRL